MKMSFPTCIRSFYKKRSEWQLKIIEKERWSYSHWNGTHWFCGTEGRGKIQASEEGIPYNLRHSKEGEALIISILQNCPEFFQDHVHGPDLPPRRCWVCPSAPDMRKQGWPLCLYIYAEPLWTLRTRQVNGTGSYKAYIQGPHCPSSSWWCITHKGDQ